MKTIEQINKLVKDPIFRANLVNDTHTYVQQLGYVKTEGVDFKVVTNTKTTFHYVIPDYHDELPAQIAELQAGKVNVSSFGTAGTAATVLSVCGTAGTVSTLATAGSAGCIDNVKV